PNAPSAGPGGDSPPVQPCRQQDEQEDEAPARAVLRPSERSSVAPEVIGAETAEGEQKVTVMAYTIEPRSREPKKVAQPRTAVLFYGLPGRGKPDATLSNPSVSTTLLNRQTSTVASAVLGSITSFTVEMRLAGKPP